MRGERIKLTVNEKHNALAYGFAFNFYIHCSCHSNSCSFRFMNDQNKNKSNETSAPICTTKSKISSSLTSKLIGIAMHLELNAQAQLTIFLDKRKKIRTFPQL